MRRWVKLIISHMLLCMFRHHTTVTIYRCSVFAGVCPSARMIQLHQFLCQIWPTLCSGCITQFSCSLWKGLIGKEIVKVARWYIFHIRIYILRNNNAMCRWSWVILNPMCLALLNDIYPRLWNMDSDLTKIRYQPMQENRIGYIAVFFC